MFWISDTIWLKFVPKVPVYSIGSDNGLVPNRQQAIIWTDDGLGWWRIYVPLGLNELIPLISSNKLTTDTP